ncbi:MAG: hypothetical protein OEQ39_17915, partial [Gammaproteobacteria bacterium]|nr:hypothetical protein [Gammaproteobacteria bacterium]
FPGDRICSRHSTSHLSHAGLSEFVTGGMDDYIALAVGMAKDLKRLGELRGRLRGVLRDSKVMDGADFTARFTHALRQMWRAAAR